jgi:signal transduction histidine kinase
VKRPWMTVRARLTALYVLVLVAATAVVLATSYGLMADHLHATLPSGAADDILSRLASQYGIALIGTAIFAVAVGWAAAGRLLRPLTTITATARRVSDERLGERIALDGPHDELRELADTFDAMLARLQESMEAQRRFVANAGHELRSPLTVIRTEAEVALADPDADAGELRRMGEAVLEATDRTEALLDGLMVLARTQRSLVHRRPVDLAAAARRAVGEASAAARAAGVDLSVRTGEAPVLGDDPLLVRLVGNLVDNAVRYNERGGHVEVATGRANGTAHVRVSNTGPRVPDAAVDRLTEPFERLGRSADGNGAGLGLSIVRAVAEAHGGGVRIAAPATGGLDVTVELPARAG